MANTLKMVLEHTIWMGMGISYAMYQFIFLKKAEIWISTYCIYFHFMWLKETESKIHAAKMHLKQKSFIIWATGLRSSVNIITFTRNTAKNTVISFNFLVWKFCEKEQFTQSFGRWGIFRSERWHFTKLSFYLTQWLFYFKVKNNFNWLQDETLQDVLCFCTDCVTLSI